MSDVKAAARQAGDSPFLEGAARAGYVASGVLHLVIAWIGLLLVTRSYSGSADQSGALRMMADSGVGVVALWVCVVGFAGLALWQVTEAIAGARETSDRLKAAAKAVTYVVLAYLAYGVVTADPSAGGKQQTVGLTADLMRAPGGRFLVALVGLGVLGVAGYHVYKGWTQKFLEDLTEHPGSFVVMAGRIGYVAKGVALAVVGVLFMLAAWHAKPSEASGLDGALRTLLGAPYGKVLLGLVSLGFASYGVYSFARAKYAKV